MLCFAQQLRVEDVALDERRVAYRLDVTRNEIVVNHDVHISFAQFSHGMRTDVTCSACDKNHIFSFAPARETRANTHGIFLLIILLCKLFCNIICV